MKEKLDQHLKELYQQQEQAKANLHAIQGAIQALERLKREAQSGDEQNSDTD